MNHLAALLNVLTTMEIEKPLATQVFEAYLSDYFQLVEENSNKKISEQDFETMQEVAHALGLNEDEFHSIMETDEKKSSKKASKDEEEDDDEIDVVDDPVEMNQLSQYINKWINPDSDPRFLF